jgi:hypothetical protein
METKGKDRGRKNDGKKEFKKRGIKYRRKERNKNEEGMKKARQRDRNKLVRTSHPAITLPLLGLPGSILDRYIDYLV